VNDPDERPLTRAIGSSKDEIRSSRQANVAKGKGIPYSVVSLPSKKSRHVHAQKFIADGGGKCQK
jgi:hypothetical protein